MRCRTDINGNIKESSSWLFRFGFKEEVSFIYVLKSTGPDTVIEEISIKD